MIRQEILARPSNLKTLVVGDITYRSSCDYELTNADLEKAYRELNEREDEREDRIRALRRKLEADEQYRYCTDDSYLLSFLRRRKFDVDKTFDTLRKGQSVRVQHPEIFNLPTNLAELCDTGFTTWLPYTDGNGRVILTAYFDRWNMAETSFHEMLQLGSALNEVICSNPLCQINGIVSIWDLKGLSMSHVTCILNPSIIWTLSSMMQDCFPNRVKLIIVLNCRGLLMTAFNTVKFFLKKKLVDRIKLIGSDITELHQYVNPAILPKRLGGMLEDDDCSITEHMVDNLPYLRYMRSFTEDLKGPVD